MEYQFEYWHLIFIIPLGIIGLLLNNYIYKNKYK